MESGFAAMLAALCTRATICVAIVARLQCTPQLVELRLTDERTPYHFPAATRDAEPIDWLACLAELEENCSHRVSHSTSLTMTS